MHTRSEPTPALVDRQRERQALDSLMEDLRSGRGRALVVRGEAGVGKSALLEYAAGAAPDMRVARAVGVESEMELAFAGVHQLCAPLLDRLARLPAPQRADRPKQATPSQPKQPPRRVKQQPDRDREQRCKREPVAREGERRYPVAERRTGKAAIDVQAQVSHLMKQAAM